MTILSQPYWAIYNIKKQDSLNPCNQILGLALGPILQFLRCAGGAPIDRAIKLASD
jgi:hypothetical protein